MTIQKRQARDLALKYGEWCEADMFYQIAENQETIDFAAQAARTVHQELLLAQDITGIRLVPIDIKYDKKEIK